MTTTQELFDKLDLLQDEIRLIYLDKCSKIKDNLIFCENTNNEEELATCLIVDIVDEINGGIYSVYVTLINKFGAFNATDLEDSENADTYSFSDISSVYNKIEMIQLIENHNE
jgi:hypothetical protein